MHSRTDRDASAVGSGDYRAGLGEAALRQSPDAGPGRPWWRDAVVYEVYPRSFADSDGDGDGDLEGLRVRLPYLAELGVDGIWIAPWYPSPMADGGYDVSDFCGIHPMFGTLEDADAVVREAHDLGLRVIIDIVPNRTSDRHPWFQAALAAGPGSPGRARYIFRDGRGSPARSRPTTGSAASGGPGGPGCRSRTAARATADRWDLLAPGAFITMALPLIVFFALQRFFVRGITAGSVKG